MSDVEITDNSDAVKDAFEAAIMRGLEKCGLTAEGYAKRLCDGFKHATGTLRNSITHQVDMERRRSISAPTSNMPHM